MVELTQNPRLWLCGSGLYGRAADSFQAVHIALRAYIWLMLVCWETRMFVILEILHLRLIAGDCHSRSPLLLYSSDFQTFHLTAHKQGTKHVMAHHLVLDKAHCACTKFADAQLRVLCAPPSGRAIWALWDQHVCSCSDYSDYSAARTGRLPLEQSDLSPVHMSGLPSMRAKLRVPILLHCKEELSSPSLEQSNPSSHALTSEHVCWAQHTQVHSSPRRGSLLFHGAEQSEPRLLSMCAVIRVFRLLQSKEG